MELQSIITCPECGVAQTETMPSDACLYVYRCPRCGFQMKPKKGSCCIFCSWGSVPCPSVQEQHSREAE